MNERTSRQRGSFGSGKHITFHQSLFDGEAHLYKITQSGEVYQFRMFIKDENKHYRRSLKTKDYDIALSTAKKLTKELMAHGISDKKVFSISVKQLIEQYIDYREHDINDETGISLKRWKSIKSQIKHFAILVGEDTKLSALNKNDLFEYSSMRNKVKKVAVNTIRMEKSTINAMIKYAYRNKLIHFDYFDFKQLIIKGDMLGRRGTFSEKEYRKLLDFLKSFSSLKYSKERLGRGGVGRDGKLNNKKSVDYISKEQNQLERLMVRDYIMILANTGMRVGEAIQLTWSCVGNYEKHNLQTENEGSKREELLVEIEVHAFTSKVRKHRKFLSRGGKYFIRLKERQKHTNDDDLIFSMNGKEELNWHHKHDYWEELMLGIGIKDWKERKLSWYSMRHYFITKKVTKGVDVVRLAKMCGTSVKQISDTYLHYRKADSRYDALL